MYIDGNNNDFYYALTFAGFITISELTSRIFHMTCDSTQLKLAAKARVATKGLIYSKIYKVSSATNKKYDKGKISNLINNSTHQIARFLWELPHITSIPMLILSCCYTLYTLVGAITIFALLIVILMITLTYFLNRFTQKFYKKRCKNDENKSSVFSEMIDNIKVIKMNSWISCFHERLQAIKQKEFNNEIIGRLLWIPHHLMHTLSHYILLIGTLLISLMGCNLAFSVASAITIKRLLEFLKDHSTHASYFTTFMSEFGITMQKIQDFLN